MSKFNYEDVIFLQGSSSTEFFNILDDQGKMAALEFLKQWHYPGEHSIRKNNPLGTYDSKFESGSYVMFWNKRLSYAGLLFNNIEEKVK